MIKAWDGYIDLSFMFYVTLIMTLQVVLRFHLSFIKVYRIVIKLCT